MYVHTTENITSKQQSTEYTSQRIVQAVLRLTTGFHPLSPSRYQMDEMHMYSQRRVNQYILLAGPVVLLLVSVCSLGAAEQKDFAENERTEQ